MNRVIKKITCLIICLVLLFGAAPLNGILELNLFTVKASAEYEGFCGNELSYIFDEKTGTLTVSGSGDMYEFYDQAPWYYYKKNIETVVFEGEITSIGYGAFDNCSRLTNITIPDSIKSIEGSAFSRCASLRRIEIPDSVTSIGYAAFFRSGLWEISIPDSVIKIGRMAFEDTSYYQTESNWENDVLYIGNHLVSIRDSYTFSGFCDVREGTVSIADYTFFNCSGLTGISIPDSVVSIGENVFGECDSLISVVIPDSVLYLGSGIFSYCNNLQNVTIGNRVTSIGAGAFNGCDSLKKINVPHGVTSIGENAFCLCSSLTEITIPETVTSIGRGAFSSSGISRLVIPDGITIIEEGVFGYCKALTDINIPAGVTKIGKEAFEGCSALTEITVPEGVTELGESAFNMCIALKSMSLPESVTKIGSWAFNHCDSLMHFEINKNNGVYQSTGNCLIKKETKTLIKGFNCSVIPDDGSVTVISSSAFCDCTGLTEITIPGCVTDIGGEAFRECEALERVSIGNGVKNIGDTAFYGCTSINEVTLPDSVTSIGAGAFYMCSGLERIDFGNGITSIDAATFSGCTSLTNITIPDSVTDIGDYAFSNCTGLESVSIGRGVTSIGDMPFAECRWLKTLTVADDNPVYHSSGNCLIETDSKTLIAGCNNSVIPNDGSVTSIGAGAFLGCSLLTEVTIPDSVTSIGRYAFYGCSGLTKISIPDGVTSMGEGVFCDCTGLVKATITDGVTDIGNSAFSGCTGLTEITIPGSVTSIGDFAFSRCTGLTEITIPDGVASLGNWVFHDCENLMSVTIPDSVTSIGYLAFDGCGLYNSESNWQDDALYIDNALIQVRDSFSGEFIVRDGTVCIAGRAFYGCTGLTGINIPAGITVIGESLFSNCSGLTEITIPYSVKRSGKYAFSGCDALVKVSYTGTLEDWCDISFEGSGSNPVSNGGVLYIDNTPVTDIVIPDTITAINNGVFEGFKSLTSITIPGSVTKIGDRAFKGCTGLTEITIPGSVTSIGASAFEGCAGLTEIAIPDSVTSIGNYAFSYCTGLTNITIPDGVTSIAAYTFLNCTELTEIVIPGSVTSIDHYAFGTLFSDKNIKTKVFFNGSIEEWCNIGFSDDLSNPLCIGGDLYIGNKLLTSLVIPDSITKINDYAFYGCLSLKEITIPDSVTSIGRGAFSGTGISRLIIPDSVTKIDYAAFACNPLYSVFIKGNSLKEVASSVFGANATVFYSGEKLGSEPWGARAVIDSFHMDHYLIYSDESKSELLLCLPSASGTVVIPASVNRIADRAFLNCDKIEKVIVKFRDSEPEWGAYVFKGCSNLKSIEYLPFVTGTVKGDIICGDDGTRLIFCNKDRNEAYEIPETVTVIEDNAFYNCKDIPSITLHASLTSIGAHAFEGTSLYCEANRQADGGLYIGNYLIDVKKDGVTEFEVKEGTTVIAACAFNGCTDLETVTIPGSVISIGHDAFAGCDNLSTVNANCSNLIYVGEKAFAGTSFYDNAESDLYVGSALINGGSLINEGTTCIADYAFAGNTELKEITIPASVKTIGNYAFADCTSLAQIYFSDGLTEIGGSAFRNCPLTRISVLTSVNKIGPGAFYGCKQITDFRVNQENKRYSSDDGVLFGVSGDSKVLIQYPAAKAGNEYTVPGDTAAIASFAFSNADNLERVFIPENTSYRSLAFRNCPAVRDTIRLMEGIEFSDDGKVLSQVTEEALAGGHFDVPDTVVMIAPEAFNSIKDKLESISLNNTAIINNNAFKGCKNLEKATNTENLVYIGEGAFSACGKLSEITIPVDVCCSPTAFDDGIKISYSGNKQKLEITNTGDNPVASGQSITLTSEIKNGGLRDGEKIVWIDSETGEKYGEETALTKKYMRNTVVSAMVMKDDEIRLQSNDISIFVLADLSNRVIVEDETGKTSTEIAAIGDETKTVSLELIQWDATSLNDILIRWLIDGKEKEEARGQTSCKIENAGKDFTVQVQFYYKGVIITETKEYTVKINRTDTIINVKSYAKVDYRSKITVKATAGNVPEDCLLAIYEGNTLREKGTKSEVVYTPKSSNGKPLELKEAKTYTVKVIDKNGTVRKDSTGIPITAEIKVDVKHGFFDKLIAFFKALFGLLPTVEIKP